MLALTRNDQEAVLIGDVLVIVVKNGHQTRLVIDAPADVAIVRTELLPAEKQAELHRRTLGKNRAKAAS